MMDTPIEFKFMKPEVKLLTVTPNAERHMAYCARVSNPANQQNTKFSGLLKYCIEHQHWSIFEQATMTVEINTSRGIAAQILRHRSFTYQEFSQRYADVNWLEKEIPLPELRRQDDKNRQNSINDLEEEKVFELNKMIRELFLDAQEIYNHLIAEGVAKECARFVLPLATPHTPLYDGFCAVLDTLHRSSFFSWNTEGTYGNRRSNSLYLYL
jgi:thymidylate synthase (FAD)